MLPVSSLFLGEEEEEVAAEEGKEKEEEAAAVVDQLRPLSNALLFGVEGGEEDEAAQLGPLSSMDLEVVVVDVVSEVRAALLSASLSSRDAPPPL